MNNQQGGEVESESMSVSFTDEENTALTQIDMAALKALLPPSQFSAIAKLISCISIFQFMARGGQAHD